MKTIVIIPAFDEEENIARLLQEILSLFTENLDILVVDDHSSDRTARCVRDFSGVPGRVRLLESPAAERGLGSCYKAAFGHALREGYERIVGMDADFSHDPADIEKILTSLNGADWVIGSRYCPGGRAPGLGFFRSLISRATNSYFRKKLGIPVCDMTSGFNGFKRSVLERIDFSSIPSQGFIFQAELKLLALKDGFRLKEVPISFNRRRAGKSKFSFKIMLESLQRIRSLKG